MTIMKKFKIILMLLFVPLLSSCFIDVYQKDQIVSDENDKFKIPIYYYSRPTCDYEVVGYVEVNDFFYTKKLLFQFMADEAYHLKADAVEIDYLHQLEMKQYVAVGKAIRCLN